MYRSKPSIQFQKSQFIIENKDRLEWWTEYFGAMHVPTSNKSNISQIKLKLVYFNMKIVDSLI